MLELAEKMEKENNVNINKFQTPLSSYICKQLLQEKEEMMKELQNMEEENKRLLDLLIKHSKGEKNNNYSANQTS